MRFSAPFKGLDEFLPPSALQNAFLASLPVVLARLSTRLSVRFSVACLFPLTSARWVSALCGDSPFAYRIVGGYGSAGRADLVFAATLRRHQHGAHVIRVTSNLLQKAKHAWRHNGLYKKAKTPKTHHPSRRINPLGIAEVTLSIAACTNHHAVYALVLLPYPTRGRAGLCPNWVFNVNSYLQRVR